MCPPPPPTHTHIRFHPSCPFVSKYALLIHTTNQSDILGQGGEQGQASKKWFVARKSSFTVYENEDLKILDYLRSIHCISVCIRGYNCCQTGIELSKCVYLASICVKIEHTVGGQNQDLSFIVMPAETRASAKVKITKIYALVHRNLIVYTDN